MAALKKGLVKRLIDWVLDKIKRFTVLSICTSVAVVLALFPELVTRNEDMQIAIQRKLLTAGLILLVMKMIDDGYMRAFDTDEKLKENPIAIAVFFGFIALALALA